MQNQILGNLRNLQQNEEFQILEEESSFDSDRPYIEISSQQFEI